MAVEERSGVTEHFPDRSSRASDLAANMGQISSQADGLELIFGKKKTQLSEFFFPIQLRTNKMHVHTKYRHGQSFG
jgi:hypothetical protein